MKFKIAALSLVLALNATAEYKAPSPVRGVESSEMALTNELDKSCQDKFSSVIGLRSSVVDFAISADVIDTLPIWPLLCSPTVNASSIETETVGQDITITYRNQIVTEPDLVLDLQRVVSEEDSDAPAYQIVRIGSVSTMDYVEQEAVRDWLLEVYTITMQDALAERTYNLSN